MEDSQDGDDLDKVERNVVELSDENCSHTLEKSRAVHVDRGADGQDKAADLLGDAVLLLHTLYHQRESGGAEKR